MSESNAWETVELFGYLSLGSFEGAPGDRWRFRDAAGAYFAPIDSRPFALRNVHDLFNPMHRGQITYVGEQLSPEELGRFSHQGQAWWISVKWDEYPDESRRYSDLPSCQVLVEEFNLAYEYIIRSGDKLKILAPGRSPRLRMNREVNIQTYNPLQQPRGIYHPCGQEGVDRDDWADWFLQRLPARLVTRRPKLDPVLESML